MEGIIALGYASPFLYKAQALAPCPAATGTSSSTSSGERGLAELSEVTVRSSGLALAPATVDFPFPSLLIVALHNTNTKSLQDILFFFTSHNIAHASPSRNPTGRPRLSERHESETESPRHGPCLVLYKLNHAKKHSQNTVLCTSHAAIQDTTVPPPCSAYPGLAPLPTEPHSLLYQQVSIRHQIIAQVPPEYLFPARVQPRVPVLGGHDLKSKLASPTTTLVGPGSEIF
ncbi:hypothetical protein FCULG_00010432 [Fusarium culmorum]|uniref:Uncharacterized protein n=1 Tax=Fusarium culmorum TaxID=5516 RepID=A0A2T4GD73_FUSCU|nr:hypothetical protein FCULG_00010432 [Fusarium culmorum]